MEPTPSESLPGLRGAFPFSCVFLPASLHPHPFPGCFLLFSPFYYYYYYLMIMIIFFLLFPTGKMSSFLPSVRVFPRRPFSQSQDPPPPSLAPHLPHKGGHRFSQCNKLGLWVNLYTRAMRGGGRWGRAACIGGPSWFWAGKRAGGGGVGGSG